MTTSAIAGPVVFNPPSVLNTSGAAAWAAVAGGPNWGGCNVWVSTDGGSNYAIVGTIDQPARFGVLTADFPVGSDPDTVNTCSVDLSRSAIAGGLTSAADATADNGGTLCLIDQELICFSTATLTAANQYNLSGYIRRGYLGTTIADHPAGSIFVRLDSAIFDFPYFATNAGQTLYVKFQSFNQWGLATQNLANCIAYSFIPYGQAAAPAGSTAWTATGGTVSNSGQALPALLISGACDNPSASAVVFLFRVSGTGNNGWQSAGQHSTSITSYPITNVAPGQTYDVGVAYIVGGVEGNIYVIGSNLKAGTISSGGNATVNVQPGSTILHSATSGAGNITLPAGNYANITVTLTGADGGCEWVQLGAPTHQLDVLYGGGKGGTCVNTYLCAPGTGTVAWNLGVAGSDGHGVNATGGGNSTCSTYSLQANGGAGATTTANGAGGNATGGSTNTTGATGGQETIGGASNGTITIVAKA